MNQIFLYEYIMVSILSILFSNRAQLSNTSNYVLSVILYKNNNELHLIILNLNITTFPDTFSHYDINSI